jgi:hypothetical protein
MSKFDTYEKLLSILNDTSANRWLQFKTGNETVELTDSKQAFLLTKLVDLYALS